MAYASKAFTECEKRFAQKEKGTLRFGVRSRKISPVRVQEIFCNKVRSQTTGVDHEMASCRYSTTSTKSAAELQKHDCVLECRKGAEMIADALIRTFIAESEEDEEGQDIAICRVVYLPMFSASLYDLEKETWADVELCFKADGESQRRLVRKTSSYRSRYPAILAVQG